jgi:hypothetical protein
MTNAFLTVEFWAAIIPAVIAIVILFGGMPAAAGTILSGELIKIITILIPAISTIGYLQHRTHVKQAVIAAVAQEINASMANTKEGAVTASAYAEPGSRTQAALDAMDI